MNTSEATWKEHLRSVIARVASTLLTNDEFNEVLNEVAQRGDSPVERVVISIARQDRPHETSFGTPLERDPDSQRTVDLSGEQAVLGKVKLWPKRGKSGLLAIGDAEQLTVELVEAFWKARLRDRASEMLSLTVPELHLIADRTVRAWVENLGSASLCFCDLDKFKDVNEKHGQSIGDQVILELGRVLEAFAPANSVVLHRSGDEYVVLVADRSPTSAVEAMYQIMTAVAQHDFKVGLPLSLSGGIAPQREALASTTWQVRELEAERALKPPGAGKQRGRASLPRREDGPAAPASSTNNLRLSVALARATLREQRPFDSPWLNAISRAAYAASSEEKSVQESVQQLVNWIAPALSSNVCVSSMPRREENYCASTFSSFDVAVAICHGVQRSLLEGPATNPLLGSEFTIAYGEDGSASVRVADHLIWSIGNSEPQDSLRFGEPLTAQPTCSSRGTQRAVAVKIGHDDLPVPKELFSEVLTIDDRPSRGGGLPDLWEAAIARLASLVVNDSNVTRVFVLGDKTNGAQTHARLSNVAQWMTDLDFITYKTGLNGSVIRAAAERLTDKVVFPNDDADLIKGLFELSLESHHFRCPDAEPMDEPRLLRRSLNMPQSGLASTDGCKVQTITDAFPIVLELVRMAESEESNCDQAGYRLREIMDFKLVLTDPSRDKVPPFYSKEAEQLEWYFQREFLAPDGLFAAPLRESNQLEPVLRHVANAVSDPKAQFATRRAILVIPHQIKVGADISPLGLISVRIVPRFLHGQVVLHFSYTWRTVEVIVGFPYSVYGSVRFAEHLLGEIRKNVSEEVAATIVMGSVSYIAHSLHLFVDDSVRNIARRIVNDASS